jgi:DNA-binding response OmpR family regulator
LRIVASPDDGFSSPDRQPPLSWPLQDGADAARDRAPAGTKVEMGNYDLSKLRVLVVERSPLVRRLLAAVLGEIGVRHVVATESPDEGFGAFVAAPADLVLVAWSSDFNGIELLRRVRTDPRSPDPRAAVIVMRSNDQSRHALTARDAGATDYLPMPLTVRELFARISAAVEDDRPFVRCPAYAGPDRRLSAGAYDGGDRRRPRAEGSDAGAHAA